MKSPTPRESNHVPENHVPRQDAQAAAIAQVRAVLDEPAVEGLSQWVDQRLEELEERFRSFWTYDSLQLRKGR